MADLRIPWPILLFLELCLRCLLPDSGAYPTDDGEDEVLSEDDAEGWESAPRPHVNIVNRVFGNKRKKGPFRITPKDIALVRSMLPLPPELITEILDLAEYWVYSYQIRSDAGRFHNANVQYLQSGPIQGGDFMYPLRRLVITTDSKDQGWSSYPETQGTREGSCTWFELTLDDGATDEEIARVEVMRNIHAGTTFEWYRAVIEDERVLKQAKKGDRLSVWVRAMYPGWCNNVRCVQIEAWSAC